jgi:hypothetical protein
MYKRHQAPMLKINKRYHIDAKGRIRASIGDAVSVCLIFLLKINEYMISFIFCFNLFLAVGN